MQLILTDNFLKKLYSLRCDYENRSKQSLKPSPPTTKIALFFGKKDIKTRAKQIAFIEHWLTLLSDKLEPDLNFTSDNEVQEHITGLRILVAVVFYIRSEIDATYTLRSSSHAILGQLLEEALALTNTNIVDQETYACCLLAAQCFIHVTQLVAINQSLSIKKNSASNFYITECEWNKFSLFINKECNNLDKKWQKSYPITTVVTPLFALPMQAAGTSIGWLLGGLTSKSYTFLPYRNTIATIFGSGLILLMEPTSKLGIMLIAPTYAGKLFDTFFGVSFAYILGHTMRLLGSSVGFGVGMSLDLSWKLLASTFSLITSAYHDKTQRIAGTGFNLINGHRIVDGIELATIKLTEEVEQLNPQSEAIQPIVINLVNNNFIIKIGDEQTRIKWEITPEQPLLYPQEFVPKHQVKSTPFIEEIFDEEPKLKSLTPYVNSL